MILLYTILYYNIDAILKHSYRPLYDNLTETISSDRELYFLLCLTSYFMATVYTSVIIHRVFITHIFDSSCICILTMYLKYVIDILIYPNMLLVEYEFSRGIMWLFTTPLMLKIFCDINNIPYLNMRYHVISLIPHILVIPFKGHWIYWGTSVLSIIPTGFFLTTLYSYRNMPFTNTFMFIWGLFISIHILEFTNLVEPRYIHAYYNLADTMCKFICNTLVFSHIEENKVLQSEMDLQSTKFITEMIRHINLFEISNSKRTDVCNRFINHSRQSFINKIPKSNDKLKLELLTKILPFDLDKNYVDFFRQGINKELTFMSVLFMDIVNYTELAKKYDGNTIFKLLDAVYNHFDNIINKYHHLQKIETIGDAYMVVGDMYRKEMNYKTVVKEITLLGLEFIREIKTIETPDTIPLSIRIGISLGSVNIGILGNEIPRLCVVGNTVNMASRLQSTADSNTIQISRHIYEQIHDIDFGFPLNIEQKEMVFLKNIGSVTTYVIDPSATFNINPL